MNRSLSFLAALGVSAFPTLAHAHFLWATIDPVTKMVAVALQENPTVDPLPLGERAALVKAWSKSAKLDLKAEGNWLKSPVKEDSVGVSLDYGVLDKRDQGRGVFWLNYFAKAAATPEASQAKLGLPVELSVVRGADDMPVVTVFADGNPSAGADVVVESSDGRTTFEGKTGPDGTVTLPATKGAIAVRGLVTQMTKGSHGGKDYELVRSYCSLTVGKPVAEASKPTMKLLQESFGNNHDVVSHTAFIETLIAGKLTKTQLEDHFQQRALVHDEVDRILRAASPSQPVPYGDDQKQPLVLLRNDLTTMGSKWPASSDAWPMTKTFIQEIEDSAKRGPYFALGVMHVYYGGITHGGRMIGRMIGDTVKVEPTYYLKSDGYSAYAQGINQITDPKAREEMIRGGAAAYRYIIASNDSGPFKAK